MENSPGKTDSTETSPSKGAVDHLENQSSKHDVDNLVQLVKALLAGERSRLPELLDYPRDMLDSVLHDRNLKIDGDGNLVTRDITLGDGSIAGSNNVIISIKEESPHVAAQLVDLSAKLKTHSEEISRIEKTLLEIQAEREKRKRPEAQELSEILPGEVGAGTESDVSEPITENLLKIKWRQFTQWFTPRIIRYGIVLLMISLLWIGFFDILLLDTRVEYLTMWIGDVLAEHEFSSSWLNNLFPPKLFSDEIVLISEAEISPDGTWGSWRQRYARLIDILSQAGAKVIGFDMSFETVSDFDGEFIRAIDQAKSRGTAIIVENSEFSGKSPRMVPEIQQAISGYGIGCVGSRAGFVRTIPLTVKLNGGYLPSLALKIFEHYNNIDDNYGIDWNDLQLLWNSGASLQFSEKETVDEDRNCEVLEGRDTARLIISYSPIKLIQRQTRTDTDVFQMKSAEAAQAFKGKIIIIGTEEERDSRHIARGLGLEYRDGFEIHADALNTILLGENIIRHMALYYQIPIMLLLAFLGASIRYKAARWHWFWRTLLFFTVLTLYITGIIVLYARYHFLVKIVYHVGTFCLAYWMTAKIRQRIPT